MRINILTPRIRKHAYTGGIYCILKYANGLVERGHEVNIIPFPASETPAWIDCRANILFCPRPRLCFSKGFEGLLISLVAIVDFITFRIKSASLKNIYNLQFNANNIPSADITLATSWETAALASFSGSGRKCYFMQHFEPIFFATETAEYESALASYSLPLVKIANSSWLQTRLVEAATAAGRTEEIRKCINAVDLDVYLARQPNFDRRASKTVRVVSYGGRDATWKGFREMAEAMAIARNELPDFELVWDVYGGCCLPPNNELASYNALGFLGPATLAQCYQQHDILLSASWYESFPLFPIEAMASGIAVITTAAGTEDYAHHGDTAYVVEAKNARSIADGLKALVVDAELRNRIAQAGYRRAQDFSWEHSVQAMEAVLEDVCRTG